MFTPTYTINTIQPPDPRYDILRKNMTLIVALKGTDGMVLASDSRTIHADLTYHDNANKIFPINNHVAVALAGEIDYIVPTMQQFQRNNTNNDVGVTEITEKLVKKLVEQINTWSKFKLNPVMRQTMKQKDPVFGVVIMGYDKINNAYTQQRIFNYNFGLLAPQEVQEIFYCEGYKDVAKRLLPSLCTDPKSMSELVEIAKNVIKESAAIHVSVGGPINIIKLSSAGTSEVLTVA